MIRLAYGIKLPKEVVEHYQQNITKENDIYYDNENKDLKFIPYGITEFVVGPIALEEDYFQLDSNILNEFTQKDEMYQLFNTSIPKVLKFWVNYIEKRTEELKLAGRTEEEVAGEMEQFEIPTSVEFNFYLIS